MKAKFAIITTGMLFVTIVNAQITESSNQAQTSNPEFVGWNGLGTFIKDLDIKNQFGNKNIVLWTNDSSSTTQRMTILGSNGNVGIGTTVPTIRLHVKDNSSLVTFFGQQTTIAGKFESENASAEQQIAVLGESDNSSDNNIGMLGNALQGLDSNVGVKGVGQSSAGLLNIGVSGDAKGSLHSNWGLFGKAVYFNDTASYALKNIGIQADASGSKFENRAGSFVTDGSNGINYSVWARSTWGDPANHDWGGAPRNYAGYFLGDMFVSGCIINQCSDSNFTIITSTRYLSGDTALVTLSKIRPQRYLNNNTGLIGLPPGPHLGFSAANLESLSDTSSTFYGLKHLVRKVHKTEEIADTAVIHTFKALTYSELIPLLVSGVNELNLRTDTSSLGYWHHSGSNLTARDTAWNVGIGTPSPVPSVKFHVKNTSQQTGAFISTTRTDTTDNIGLFANAEVHQPETQGLLVM